MPPYTVQRMNEQTSCRDILASYLEGGGYDIVGNSSVMSSWGGRRGRSWIYYTIHRLALRYMQCFDGPFDLLYVVLVSLGTTCPIKVPLKGMQSRSDVCVSCKTLYFESKYLSTWAPMVQKAVFSIQVYIVFRLWSLISVFARSWNM